MKVSFLREQLMLRRLWFGLGAFVERKICVCKVLQWSVLRITSLSQWCINNPFYCMCMHVCRVYVCIFACIQCVCVCVCVCVYLYLHLCMCMGIYVCASMYMHLCIRVWMDLWCRCSAA